MPKITIFNNPNRDHIHDGDSDEFDGPTLDLTDEKRGFLGLAGTWNDKVTFVKIEGGTWRLYKDANRGGEHWDYSDGIHYVGDKDISGFEPI